MAHGGEDLAVRLHDWAIHEMDYRPTGRHADVGLPSPDDFKRYCYYGCRRVRTFCSSAQCEKGLSTQCRRLVGPVLQACWPNVKVL